MNFSVGQLIKWYEEFDEGIVKDAGMGLIIEIKKTRFYGKRYKIYRNKHKDVFWFSENCLQKIGENNE